MTREEELTPEQRIKLEMQRLHHEVTNCAHCAALRGQMAHLFMLLPPDPIEANGMRYAFDPPDWWKERMAEEAKRIERMMGEAFHGEAMP